MGTGSKDGETAATLAAASVSDVAQRRNPGLSALPSVADAPPLTASIPFRAGAEAPFVRVPARGIDNGGLHGGALPIHVGQDRVDFPDCPGVEHLAGLRS